MSQPGAAERRKITLELQGLEVWLDDASFGPILHLGRLHRVGSTSVRFEYANAWLKSANAFALDPELALSSGSFHPKESNFGIFMDSSPDRWGQVLMKRRELVEAKKTGRTKRDLTTWDFFLGVQDVTRLGALRFSPLQPGATLKNGDAPTFDERKCLADEVLAAPALTQLAELQKVALALTGKKVDDLNLLERWLSVLVAPGASLGGARPKANLQDGKGDLWIAKFPSADDEHDWALREKLVHELACSFELDTAESRVELVGSGYHTFITRRFDRAGGRRRFFTSAMALLGKVDSEGASYLDLAQYLTDQGVPAHRNTDLRELFRRVLFNVAVGNRDDHLRNHGFIREPSGWRLAPAYDMNPSTKKDEHVLALDDQDPAPSIDTVIESAEFYRVTPQHAKEDVSRLWKTMATWETKAKALGLGVEDRLELQDVFLLD